MKARLPQGYGGGPQNMNAMIRQAQKIQEEMETLQAELDAKYDAANGGTGIVMDVNTGAIVAMASYPNYDPGDFSTIYTEELQAELDAKEYEVNAGGGMVTVKINGKKEILNIDIKPEIVDPEDIETLSDTLVAAVNEALRRVEQTNSEAMGKLTGGMNLPGMF